MNSKFLITVIAAGIWGWFVPDIFPNLAFGYQLALAFFGGLGIAATARLVFSDE